jgi:predicted DNA-binding transcriptional regulator AlpA
MPRVTDQHPPTLRRGDVARLLNVSNERARQITNGDDFPPPVITSPSRAWSREDVEAWMDEVNWWDRYRWRKPAG